MTLTYITLPTMILLIRDLNIRQKLILALAISFNGNGLRMSNAALGEILDIRADTVSDLIAGMESKGYIQITGRQSRWRKIYLGNNPKVKDFLLLGNSRSKEVSEDSTSEFSPIYLGNNPKHNIKNIKETKKRVSSASIGSKRFKKPTPAEVATYAGSIDYQLDGDAFCDYYDSVGWSVGKKPMKDWRAAVRTWKTRNKADDITVDTWRPPTLEQVEEMLEKSRQQYAGELYGT